MFSGKTTELIRRLKRYQVANHRCLIIKYAKDQRYTTDCADGVATHDHQSLAAVPATVLSSVQHLAEQSSVIGIDEGQFFPDIVEFAEEQADKGKIVVVAALDGTYQRSGFGNILNLIPLAERVAKLTAVCMRCYGEAAYTQRLGSETQVELIGGTEKYMAVCRECYKMEEDDEACHGNRISSPFPMIKSHHPKNIHASPEKLYCTNSSGSSSSSNKENLADHAAL